MKRANKWAMQVLATLTAIGVAPLAMAASELGVSITGELNGALLLAHFQPSTIKLVQGTYSLKGTPLSRGFEPDHTPVLLGGYTARCNARDMAASKTTIAATSTQQMQPWLIGVTL